MGATDTPRPLAYYSSTVPLEETNVTTELLDSGSTCGPHDFRACDALGDGRTSHIYCAGCGEVRDLFPDLGRSE